MSSSTRRSFRSVCLGRAWAAAQAFLALALFCCAGTSGAAGTAAGTLIGNRATLTYSIEGRQAEPAVAVAPAISVARLIDVRVTWQDSAPVPARSPDAQRPLAFVITNLGNGAETFRLSRTDALAADQFDPSPAAGSSIWLESGAEPGFQSSGPNADIPYAPGVNDPDLPADRSRTAYLLSVIPANVPTGSFGTSALVATATTPGAASAARGSSPGTFGGVQAVVALPQTSAAGSYLVAGVSLGLAKSVVAVRDPTGGPRVMTGAVLTYRLQLTLTGTGIAEGVAVSDPLPPGVTYVPGSLVVDGVARSDAADADRAGFANNTVSADFGDVPAPASRVLEFQATVN